MYKALICANLSHQTSLAAAGPNPELPLQLAHHKWEGGPTKRPVEIYTITLSEGNRRWDITSMSLSWMRVQPRRIRGCSLAVATLQFLYLRRLSCPFRRGQERRVAPANSEVCGTSSRLTTLIPPSSVAVLWELLNLSLASPGASLGPILALNFLTCHCTSTLMAENVYGTLTCGNSNYSRWRSGQPTA